MKNYSFALICVLLPALAFTAESELSAEDLAKQSQNPVGDLISVPVEIHHYDGIAGNGSVNALFVKPVYPLSIGRWNLINRLIIPVLSVDAGNGEFDLPEIGPIAPLDDQSGLGNIQYQGFFSPAEAGKVIWGVGPVLEMPTHSRDLGNDNWSAGVAAVALAMPGGWVVGALMQNLWSITDKSGAVDVNKMTFQYFVNYNMANGWYLTSTPVNTADWNKSGGERWTIPAGGGVGRLMRFGNQPVDFKLQGFGYLAKPDNGPDWNLQFAVKLLFPK